MKGEAWRPAWLPAGWRDAFERDAVQERPLLADPLPERRVARLLAAFIAAGLVFLVLPGTLLGVWNLINISSRRHADAAATAWIQAHGHAQLFGWVATFMLGIALYAVPKFRGGTLGSLALGWVMFGAWTCAVAARWLSAVGAWRWQLVWPVSAALELAVAFGLLWQSTASGPSRRKRELWEALIFTGIGGLILTLAVQLAQVSRTLPAPIIPPAQDRVLVSLALWAFCFPMVWGFSVRLLPTFLGLARPGTQSAIIGLGLTVAATVFYMAERPRLAAAFTLGAVALACWSLRIFQRGERPPKLAGVDPLYPWFARAAYGWLAGSALLGFGAASPGFVGASRHAFTVGYLATMIFSIGPRILPSFLNSRELWSKSLMRAALVLLTAGCALRVCAEPLAYAAVFSGAWRLLPVSALLELSAVLLFALNIGKTLATPVPAWFGREQVKDSMSLYWYVSSYPATRQLLIEAGLITLAKARSIPWSLTLREAAEADGVDPRLLVEKLGDFFETRMARAVRRQLSG